MELLIYIGLLSVIVAMVGAIFISINKGRGQAEAKMEVNSALNFATEKISQDIHSASAVTTPASGNSETLAITVSGTATTYCVVDGKLHRQTGGGECNASSPALTSDLVTIAAPTFTRLENTNITLSKTIVSVEMTLTASYNSTSPDWQYSETKKTTASLR